MWILPTRSRPHNIKRLSDAYIATGACTPVWMRVDDDDPMLDAYKGLILPEKWIIEVGARQPLSVIYNEFYTKYPDLKWYGFIADDVVPETAMWDQELIEAACPDKMAVPAGGHDIGGAPHFVLGGDLVRRTEFLSLPGLNRLYIDAVWQDIASDKGVLIWVNDVVLRHHHFSNGLALKDNIYKKTGKDADKLLYFNWKQEDKT